MKYDTERSIEITISRMCIYAFNGTRMNYKAQKKKNLKIKQIPPPQGQKSLFIDKSWKKST